jgi:hypothetical protein
LDSPAWERLPSLRLNLGLSRNGAPAISGTRGGAATGTVAAVTTMAAAFVTTMAVVAGIMTTAEATTMAEDMTMVEAMTMVAATVRRTFSTNRGRAHSCARSRNHKWS